MARDGTFYWNELVTADQKRSGDFYCALLGWNRRQIDVGGFGIYTLFVNGDRDAAGMMNAASDYSRARPSWWSAYISVNDVDAKASLTAKLGGKVVEPATDIPDVGRACMIADSMGAVVALITPMGPQEPASVKGPPVHGTFMWNHLVTMDQRKSGEFYGNLLGWSRQEMNAGPFGTYTLFACDGEDVAGMMNPTIDYTRSRPSSWYAYIAVKDVDDCALRVGDLGGKVIEAPHEVPGVGRACLIADPMGAAVTLMTPAKRS